jgi:hypothetical protein
MQWQTAVAAGMAPTLIWLSRKAMAPIVRRVRKMPDGKLKRLLLVGDDRLLPDRPTRDGK